jgi:hypothetical protein
MTTLTLPRVAPGTHPARQWSEASGWQYFQAQVLDNGSAVVSSSTWVFRPAGKVLDNRTTQVDAGKGWQYLE